MIDVLYFTGLTMGDKGLSSYGAVMYDNETGREVDTTKGILGITTNNVANYYAMLFGIELCKKKGATNVLIRSNAHMVIHQMNGIRPCTDPLLRLLYRKCKYMEHYFDEVTYEYVGAQRNRRSYELANMTSLIYRIEESDQLNNLSVE